MDNLKIEITIGEHSVYRNYAIVDGQTPDNMQEEINDMVETLLDKEEKF